MVQTIDFKGNFTAPPLHNLLHFQQQVVHFVTELLRVMRAPLYNLWFEVVSVAHHGAKCPFYMWRRRRLNDGGKQQRGVLD